MSLNPVDVCGFDEGFDEEFCNQSVKCTFSPWKCNILFLPIIFGLLLQNDLMTRREFLKLLATIFPSLIKGI